MKSLITIIQYAFMVTATLTVTSCNKLLETTPKSFVSEDNYYNTEEQLFDALAGVYDILGDQSLYRYRNLVWFNNEGDEGYYRNSSTTSTFTFNYSSNDPQIQDYWQAIYSGINRANFLLANVDKNTAINESYRRMIRGEALFLRAFYYFSLVQNFGDVPLILTPTTSTEDLEVSRTPIKQVYEQIIQDMEEAEPLVLDIRELGFGGRVSKSAVRGILARVCLHMAGYPLLDISRYEDARKWAKMVIDDTQAQHELNPSYNQIFINYAEDTYDINESIWEVEFWGNASDAFRESGHVGYYNGIGTNNDATGRSNGGLRATYKLYTLFDQEDLRRDFAIANFTYDNEGPNGAKTPIIFSAIATYYDRYCGKFRREYEKVTPKNASNTPINFPLLRYADVLLMYAEAENAVHGPENAYQYVNEVRRRGYGKHLNYELVQSIAITNGGNNYTSVPTITISGGGGSGAQAKAFINAGKINRVLIENPGENYTSEPAVTVSGGGGAGAVLRPVITKLRTNNPDLTSDQISSKEALLEAIIDERSRELCFEGLRRHDLIRWGLFVTNMNEIGAMLQIHAASAYFGNRFRIVSDKHLLWPIPASEFSVNRLLTQNPKW